MLVNIPIIFYSSILASIINNETSHNAILASQPMMVLYCLPVAATILTWISDLPRQLKLSKLYDSNGQPIRAIAIGAWKKYLPFLPDAKFASRKEYDSVHQYLMQKQKNKKSILKNKNACNNTHKPSWALVTGASKGIGRAIAISLARRNIPVVLVARDSEKLQSLSQLIQECYGVKTMVVKCDIGSDDNLNAMMDALAKACIEIEILVNNAGLGETCEFIDLSPEKMEQMNQVNVMGTTKLTHRFGSEMMKRRRGRIVIVSSLAGAMPGVPTAAMYAATKSYQRSLSSSLGRELEGYGVGVTCVMPGAVTDTNFQSDANMMDSTIFKFPIGGLTPEIVAEIAVRAVISGRQEVFVGWMNVIMGRLMSTLLPARLQMLICELTWRPLPLRQLFSGSKTKKKMQ